MRQLKALVVAMMISAIAMAQTFPAQTSSKSVSATRGGTSVTPGTWLPIGYINGQNETIVTGTVTPASSIHPDTLVSPAAGVGGYTTDSGYVFWNYSSVANRNFDFSVTALSGTLAGNAILQGSQDGQTWYTLTSDTSNVQTWIRVVAPLSGSGTTHYQWYLKETDENYRYHQIRAILSGTCTAIFGGNLYVAH